MLSILELSLQLRFSRELIAISIGLPGLAICLMLALTSLSSSLERRINEVITKLEGIREEIGKGFTDLREAVKGLGGDGEGSTDPQEKREEVRTSGAGAFAGMVVGGLIGLAFGPLGVIAGGLLAR